MRLVRIVNRTHRRIVIELKARQSPGATERCTALRCELRRVVERTKPREARATCPTHNPRAEYLAGRVDVR